MKKAELVATVASDAKVSRKEAERVMKSLVVIIQKAMAEGDKVHLVGLCTFEARDRIARDGRDPRNGNAIKIPARKIPVFKASKTLKGTVNRQAMAMLETE